MDHVVGIADKLAPFISLPKFELFDAGFIAQPINLMEIQTCQYRRLN